MSFNQFKSLECRQQTEKKKRAIGVISKSSGRLIHIHNSH